MLANLKLSLSRLIIPLQRSLFLRIGLMVAGFSVILIFGVYYFVMFSYTEQDTILDAHEYYYYSEMVSSWGVPPDTTTMLQDLKNLKMMCVVLLDTSDIWWAHPKPFVEEFSRTQYISYSDSEFLGEIYDINIPLEVSFGDLGEQLMCTYVKNSEYEYFLAIDYAAQSDFWLRFIPTSIFILLFMSILFLFMMKKYLHPITLMKERVIALEKGDLKSKITIQGKDELARLSHTINKLIDDTRGLLNKKQELLSEVSHELRSPMARMQLLLEMSPDHKNKSRLKKEIAFLEGMISNLLLSDKLSLPYTNLDLNLINLPHYINSVIAVFPESHEHICVTGELPNININIDEIKMKVALRNLIDNALKYNNQDTLVKISCIIRNENVHLSVSDDGHGINDKDISRITTPFYRTIHPEGKRKTGFGLGLSICKKIIEAHRGQIKIKSKVRVGSVFTIIFPTK